MPSLFSHISINQREFLCSMKNMGLRRNIPNISFDTAEYLFHLLGGKDVKNILEIGPANGFSTLILEIACPEAEIHSIECSRHAFEELRENVRVYTGISDFDKEHRRKSSIINLQLSNKNQGNNFQKGNESLGKFINYEPFDGRLKIEDGRLASSDKPAELSPKIKSNISQEIIGCHHLYYADARELLPAFLEGAQEVHCENPKSILHTIPKMRFDVIFIDGAFRMTREFFDLSLPLLHICRDELCASHLNASNRRNMNHLEKNIQKRSIFCEKRVPKQGVCDNTPSEEWSFEQKRRAFQCFNPIIIIDDAIKYRWKMDGFHEYLEEQGIPYELVQTDPDDGIMIVRTS